VGSTTCRFCGWASSYETDELSRVLGNYQRQALELLAPTESDLLLDVGCGSGAAVRRAARAGAGAVGVDACPTMIARAQQLGSGLERARLVVANADSLPFAEGVFTALLCTSVLRHVSDRAAATREMARVLVPGGRAVVGDFLPEPRRRRRRASRRQAREAATAWLAGTDLVVGRHIVCSTFLGPFLITHATKVAVAARTGSRRRRYASHDWRPIMQIERSQLAEVLRQRGSERTAEAVAQQLPEHIDTRRDRDLIEDCGIDPDVLERVVTATDR
jgi:ubiquinone/menaquinone biosynthesis C-methylase UbiE